jgi:hypothetical protein
MKMPVGDGWRVVMYCMVVIGAIVDGRAQTRISKPVNEALNFSGDGAQRSKDIHWPDGFPVSTSIKCRSGIRFLLCMTQVSSIAYWTSVPASQAWNF